MKTIMLITFTLIISVAFAGPGAPPATPIDGGLGLLLAAGAGYGMKKIADKRRRG